MGGRTWCTGWRWLLAGCFGLELLEEVPAKAYRGVDAGAVRGAERGARSGRAAVAGLMGADLVLFPRVQLWVMLLFWRVRMPVAWYLGAWAALQVVMQTVGARGTAWMTHLGGFAVGAATALLLRTRPALQRAGA